MTDKARSATQTKLMMERQRQRGRDAVDMQRFYDTAMAELRANLPGISNAVERQAIWNFIQRLLKASRKRPPQHARKASGGHVPDDTPCLDTSFHDHEMDVG